MIKLWQPYQLIVSVVILMFVMASVAPVAPTQTAPHNAATGKYSQHPTPGEKIAKTPLETTRPPKKSVPDAEVLASPITFFKDIFSADRKEEESDITPKAGKLILALKALAATLLATII